MKTKTTEKTRITTKSTVYRRIRDILESAHAFTARSVNTTQVVAYWLIGREIVEEEQRGQDRAEYGKQLIVQLAERIKKDFGKGYSAQNLFYMRQFYHAYTSLIPDSEIFHASRGKSAKAGVATSANEKFHALRGKSKDLSPFNSKPGTLDATNTTRALEIEYAAHGESWRPGLLHPNLSWTHYRTLLRVESAKARAFYEIEAIKNHWAARELERQINSLLFERLAVSKDKAGLMRLTTKGQEIQTPTDVFKDPFVIEFLGLPDSSRLKETDLEASLISNLQSFLLELGKGFAFLGRQERLTLDGDHFYIDLVFYHTVLKCFVLIDLKVGKLTHADLGQLQLYVNYYDQERRTKGDGPTLGLILCTDKNDAVVRYMVGAKENKTIFTSRYKLHLPTETELVNEIKREVRLIACTQPNKPRKKKS